MFAANLSPNSRRVVSWGTKDCLYRRYGFVEVWRGLRDVSAAFYRSERDLAREDLPALGRKERQRSLDLVDGLVCLGQAELSLL